MADLIQCDRCRRHEERETATGWQPFKAAFGEVQFATAADVCPECQDALKEGIASLLEQSAVPTASESIDAVEHRHVLCVLTAHDWNKSQAAEILGIERSTLDRKLKKWGLMRPDQRRSRRPTGLAKRVRGVWINPNLPANFDSTPNDQRPDSHKKWWNHPYIVTYTDSSAEWLKHWPGGTRYDVRCLDGGAWDRSTCLGSFGSLDEAIRCAKAKEASPC